MIRQLVADLQEQISQLTYRQELLMRLVDPQTSPFSYLLLEAKATRDQEKQVMDLMDSIRKMLAAGQTPLSHGEFEQRIYEIIPSHNGDYHFAEGIVSTLKEENKWTEVFDYYKNNGMNLGA